uniref:separase n=1 Tax=Gouania willdenowi TaxID=441366 RepID=A0A8C5GC86_GOUWI
VKDFKFLLFGLILLLTVVRFPQAVHKTRQHSESKGRTLCDRIIRACNHQLGTGNLDFDHTGQLVKLFELSLHGYDRSTALVAKSSPLYMEKIIFHVVKKLSSLKVFTLCTHVAGLLYSRLAAVQTVFKYFCVLVRSCFSVLWNGASLANDEKVLNLRDRVHCQMQALSFLLLLDSETTIPSQLKALVYTDDVINEFETRCGVVSKEDASFLLQEMRSFFNRYLSPIANCEGEKSKLHKDRPSLYAITAMGLTVVKMLCKASHYNQASAFLSEIESMASDFQCQGTAFVLSKCGVKIHSALKTDNESCSILTECARALRSLSTDVSDGEAHAVLEGCSLVVWAVESGHNKELSGPGLLALFSFLEEHQELLLKIINRVIVVVIAVSNLACGLYNRRLYDQAFTLVEILLLCLSLGFEPLIYWAVHFIFPKFTRPFMLAVQTSRRAGQLERALDWVIVWLKALGDNIPNHMAEPVSLWVKTKMDAARNSEDDIRLRTLRDGFGADVPDEAVMLGLLEEELLAYKEVLGDTAQERYNTLCDLLDICHAESPRTHLRGIYLCEMAQVVCFQDFSEQTDCMAVDFTHEALRLLEEEPETPENADRLQDDKAHALLWHYICTLEKNLQESVANPVGNNDFDYEDKQKTQDSIMVYEGLQFNLAAETSKKPEPLEKSLDGWSALFQRRSKPSVRNPKQTCSSISVTAALFKLMGKIGVGVPYLCQVLKEVNEQRQSKTWYLLRAQTFQTCSSYLNLDTTQLPQSQRSCIAQHGIKNPDTALYESLKLLCSLLVTVVGKGLYGSSNSNTSDVPGDNLVLKWQLLSELLNCAVKIVAVRRLCGALNDARLQCLEALKLAIKLQALSQCAELLVMKAELELMQGEREESKTDLDKVRHLLELCTGLLMHIADVKIKPRKGRPAQKSQSPLPAVEDDLTGLLSTRWIAKEPVVTDLTCSPPLKAQPRRWLSSLAHESDCQCPCCSEPCLGRATARWAATQADLVLQLDSNEASIGFKLHRATLSRCMTVATKVGANLSKIFPSRVPSKGPLTPSLMEDLVGRVYLHMALFGLEPSLNKVYGIWKILRAGLTFVDSTSSPVLRPVKAGLMVTKAIASLMVFAAKKGCAPVELFSNVWMWKVLEEMKEMKQGVKIASSLSKLRKPNDASKVPDVRDKNKETKKVKVVKVRGSASAQKAPRAGAKLHFHVYEELSPVQSKAQLVPAAPQRSKKSRFKVEFSDESDSEASTKAECQKEAVVRKRQTTARRAAMSATMAPGPPTQKVPLTLQKKEKKSTTVPRSVSSEDEERLIHQPLARRGRSRKHLSKMDVDVDEPDKMRAIEEETKDVLNISTEQLRTSDTEQAKDQACLRDASILSFFFSDDVSLEDVQSLLRSAWLILQHHPSPSIYPTLCALLALTTGQRDPRTTAMLHAQSLGITSRHPLLCFSRKLKKASNELTDKMGALTLNVTNAPESNSHFGFSSSFYTGVTVCLMSMFGMKPGEMGDDIMLSRLTSGSDPFTVCIHTAKGQVSMHPISWLVQEMDNIMAEQKVVSCVSEKAKWWEGRRALDSRVEVNAEKWSGLLGCWKILLLPASCDPELSKQTQHLSKALSSHGTTVSEEMLKAVLSASPVLSDDDIKRFAHGLCPQWNADSDQLFYSAVSQLSDRAEPRSHMVLIMDKYLQKLPWESISVLKSCSVSRMPSLQSLLGLSVQKEVRLGCNPITVVSQQGGKDAHIRFPACVLLLLSLPTKYLFTVTVHPSCGSYVGHGAGARFLDSQSVLKRQMRAASLLFGCSSAALAVRGDQEGQDICPYPLVLGNLWDVTDRDIDRFTKVLLESWLSAGSGAPLLEYMGPSRQATILKNLIGAAPVVYGLPIHLL